MGDGATSYVPGKSREEPKIGSGKDSSGVVRKTAQWAFTSQWTGESFLRRWVLVGPSPGPHFSSVRTEEAWKARPGVGSLGDAGWGRWRGRATPTWDPGPGPAPGVRHQPAPRSRVLFGPARAAVGALSPPAVAMAPARGS